MRPAPFLEQQPPPMPAIISEPKNENRSHVLSPNHAHAGAMRAPRKYAFGRRCAACLVVATRVISTRALPAGRWSSPSSAVPGGALPLASRQRSSLTLLAPDHRPGPPGKGREAAGSACRHMGCGVGPVQPAASALSIFSA